MQVTTMQEPSPAAVARRAQIVAAAIECIAELGYGRASFAQIAKRAGISSTRLISYHFANKDDLMRAVVEEALRAAGEFMRPRIAAATDRAGMLSAYITSNVDFMREHRAHIRAVTEIVANARSADGADVAGALTPDPSVGMLVRHFIEGQAEGAFRAFDPRVMAVSVRSAIDAVAGQMAGDPHLDLEAYAGELVTLFDCATRRN